MHLVDFYYKNQWNEAVIEKSMQLLRGQSSLPPSVDIEDTDRELYVGKLNPTHIVNIVLPKDTYRLLFQSYALHV